VLPGSVADGIARISDSGATCELEIEHPTGFFTVVMDVVVAGGSVEVRRAALVRTARKLMSGEVFVPARAWSAA
jgi:4-oxalomesaconate tautomerase